MAERSNAAVLKTVEVKASGGSNPSPSAKNKGRSAPFIFGVSKVRTTAAEENRDCGIVLSAVGSRFAAACGCEAIEPLQKEENDANFIPRRSSLSFRHVVAGRVLKQLEQVQAVFVYSTKTRLSITLSVCNRQNTKIKMNCRICCQNTAYRAKLENRKETIDGPENTSEEGLQFYLNSFQYGTLK